MGIGQCKRRGLRVVFTLLVYFFLAPFAKQYLPLAKETGKFSVNLW